MNCGITIESAPAIRVYPVSNTPSGYVSDYLRKMGYRHLDYDYAREYFKSRASIQIGACTSFSIGGWYCRNLDWHYSEQCDFVLDTNGEIDVLGVAGGLSTLTKEVSDSGDYNDGYRILPFYLQDGRAKPIR